MKLILKNFRCHEDKTFDLGDQGLTLISGESGSGKTTIMHAILFALFGHGSKLTTWNGATHCSVTLITDYLKVVRTKGPNTLLVDDIYENESGQEKIDTTIGKNFNVAGYLQQSAVNSFVLMSPQDKLAFLEKFAMDEIDMDSIKSKLKRVTSRINDELVESTSKLDMVTQWIGKEDNLEPMDFPVRCKPSQRSLVEKNKNVILKNCAIKLKKVNRVLKQARKELTSTELLENELISLGERIESDEKNIDELRKREGDTKFIGKESLQDLEDELKMLVDNRKYIDLRNREREKEILLKEIESRERAEIEEELSGMDLWKEYSREECIELISDLEKELKDATRLEQVESELEGLVVPDEIDTDEYRILKETLVSQRKLLEKIRHEKRLLTCPSCSSTLKFHENKLVVYGDEKQSLIYDESQVQKEILDGEQLLSEMGKQIFERSSVVARRDLLREEKSNLETSYEEPISSSEARENHDEITQYKNYCESEEKRKIKLTYKLENKEYSSLHSKTEKELNNIRSLISEIGSFDEPISQRDEEELRNLINQNKMTEQLLQEISRQIDQRTNDILSNRELIRRKNSEHIEVYKSKKETSFLKGIITSKEAELSAIEEEKQEAMKTLEEISRWKIYEEKLNKLESLNSEQKQLKSKECQDSKKYSAVCQLKDFILEAESIALINIVNEIDTHAQLYLDAFFPNDPLKASLEVWKKTKKNTKPQVNLKIHYKGTEMDISPLSTGELARVTLAYTLALNTMFNIPVLLLDECAANLDQNLTSIVLETVRENSLNKLVVIVAHQCISGTFDTLVEL